MRKLDLDAPEDLSTGAYDRRKQRRDKWRRQKSNKMNQRRAMVSIVNAIVPKDCSVIDIGAGVGHVVTGMRELGYEAFGIDGTADIDLLTDGLVQQCDLTNDCSRYFGVADWGIFEEVGEHIPKEFEQAMIDNVARIPTKGLIVGWALPRHSWMPGHVNCKELREVKQEFVNRDWVVDDRMTEIAIRLIKRKQSYRYFVVVR